MHSNAQLEGAFGCAPNNWTNIKALKQKGWLGN